MALSVKGCSFECYKDTVEPKCCPGYWGNDCIGEFEANEDEFCGCLCRIVFKSVP